MTRAGAAGPAAPGQSLAERIAAAVLTAPSVADLNAGPFGTVATYLPGRRVEGVRIGGDDTATDPSLIGTVEVHVAGRYPFPVSAIAHQIRAAAASVLAGVVVDVVIEDYL